ncbi:hypothetical protein [Streptococcus cristatus]|uniref:hypothetical protein n=1 Tax=Streptococcus cristatus TaxID=45634 RepID=UPI000F66059D|nr:hypothetical protein [Streptococcus cristatus]RSJ73346.1 hypothetical protein D8799_03615 [Streptococcus cristatus]
MKLIKRLVGIVLVLLLAAVLFLVPSFINPNEQLKNVQANTSWESMIEPTLNNANVTAQGVSTEVSLNSVQLNQLLKSSLTDSDNQELLNGAYSIEGNKLRIQYPVKLIFIDSKLDLEVDVTVKGSALYITIDNAKLGILPIPKSWVTGMLKQQLQTSNSTITTEGDSFLLSLPQSPFSIDKISLQNGVAKIQISMAYGIQ